MHQNKTRLIVSALLLFSVLLALFPNPVNAPIFTTVTVTTTTSTTTSTTNTTSTTALTHTQWTSISAASTTNNASTSYSTSANFNVTTTVLTPTTTLTSFTNTLLNVTYVNIVVLNYTVIVTQAFQLIKYIFGFAYLSTNGFLPWITVLGVGLTVGGSAYYIFRRRHVP